MNDNDTLQIYGQAEWHDDATIVGTRGALIALRDLIDTALGIKGCYPHTAIETFFPSDGEGYNLYVVEVEDEKLMPTLNWYSALKDVE